MDSEVLLHAVVMLRERLPAEIRAVHLDHGLHPDSAHWADHCRRSCERLGVPLTVRRVAVAPARGESPEAAAREARYRALAEVLEGGDLLLTAQHRDDQAETLLLALLRGAGLKGLAAMPVAATLGVGLLLRPLLPYGRAELRAYAERRGLAWVDDPSNADLAFDRNLIRHRVLPLIAERWPACTATIARTAAHCAEAQGLIDRLAERGLAGLAGGRPGTLSIAGLEALDPALRRAVLRHWIAGRGFSPPSAKHLERILDEVLAARADAAPLVLWTGCEVRRYRDDLYAMKPLPPRPGCAPIPWVEGTLELPIGLGRLGMLDGLGQSSNPANTFPGGLAVRFGVEGLACRPDGTLHHRTLKKLFQELGVPPWLRRYVPLVLAGESLVAVAGLWVCEPVGPDRGGAIRIRWWGHAWEALGIF